MALERILVVQEFVLNNTIPKHIHRMALGNAYYMAARISYFDRKIPAKKFLFLAFKERKAWVEEAKLHEISYILFSPVSRLFNPVINTLLRNLEGQIMERRKILIIGMFDSIHLARWLSQFENEKIDFVLFPSKKFKYANYDLLKLVTSQKIASYRFAKPYFVFKYIGFMDYFLVLIFKLLKLNLKLLF